MLYDFKIKTKIAGKDGVLKSVNQEYLTDREFFSEVEQEGLRIDGAEDVIAIARITGASEIINQKESETDLCYKATVSSMHQVDGKETSVRYTMFCWAGTIDEASVRVKEYLEQGYDMKLEALKETKIKAVI